MKHRWISFCAKEYLPGFGSSPTAAQCALHDRGRLTKSRAVEHHRAPVLPSERANQVENDRGNQQQAGDPVPHDPVELQPENRQERGPEQREHAHGREPMEHAIG